MNTPAPMASSVLFILLPALITLHELEEWNISAFHKKFYASTPSYETPLGTRLWLLALSLFACLWALAAWLIPHRGTGATMLMLLVDFSLLNGAQHLAISLTTKAYNPGLVFGGLVGVPLGCAAAILLATTGALPAALVGLLVLPVVPAFITTLPALRQRTMPPALLRVLAVGHRLETFLSR